MRLIVPAATGALLALTALAACSQTVETDFPVADAEAAAPCAASSYQVLIGQPAGEIDTSSLPQPVRMLGAGEVLSPAPSPGRMTIVTNQDGRVGQVICN